MPKPKTEKQLNFFIPEEWHESLRRQAFEERRPIAALVRDALRLKYGFVDPEPDEGRKGGFVYGCPAHGSSALADG